ncbi:hypothetical protein KGF57_002571 [Candida theae]|uniref:NAD-dependent epimerase/dehydratase domain-containing protein n=1 Tax=Candida theae TaxID=1198502 RepID=A0AAD5FYK6_9ASCO|nr:uncharacterized protein KGF57_002571 [Candida theae]KAI5958216.1 hypothetical protein KGF57_002571 [Candida theae]
MSVFVTGATGYIAQHVVKELLAQGYKVIGSVRSEAKGEYLSKLINSPQFSFAVVPDIAAEGAFDHVLQEHESIGTFIHTASPVDFEVSDIQTGLLDPAIEGTKNVLLAVEKYGKNVRNVIVTSSTSAVRDVSGKRPSNSLLTESSWNEISIEQGLKNPRLGYAAAKTFAEKEVWKFAKENQDKFNVTTVNPTYVFGPQAFKVQNKDRLNDSAEYVNKILKLKPDEKIPTFVGLFIDVRDVARAHVAAIKNPKEFNGQRLVLINSAWTNELLAAIINKQFPEVAIPKGSIGASDEELKKADLKWDNSKTKQLLGFEFIPIEKSVTDAVQQLLDS